MYMYVTMILSQQFNLMQKKDLSYFPWCKDLSSVQMYIYMTKNITEK